MAETFEGSPGDAATATRPIRSSSPSKRARSSRLPEGPVLDPGDVDVEFGDDETMIINMGPQHPSTHGVLRIMMELEGETVLRSKPIIGYLHTGMEKTGEELTYVQGATNVTRMDYLAPLHNELVFSLAVEALLGSRDPAEGDLDPDAHGRAQPDLLARHVDGDERHGPRFDIDDDLRLSRAGDDPVVLREDDRASHEPRLHPARRRRGRPPRRVGGRRHGDHRHDPGAPRRVRRDADRPADLQRAHRGRRAHLARAGCRHVGHRPDPPGLGGGVGPPPSDALPRLRRGRLRRHRRHGRRHLRPLRGAAQRDPRVVQDRPPVRRDDAARATTGSRTRR